MKKHLLKSAFILFILFPILGITQVELRPLELREEEPYKASEHYLLFGDVKEVTTAHYTDLFGEVSLSTTETLKFNKKGLKTEEYIAYTGILEMDFLTKFYYDSKDRLVEVKWVDAENPSQVDQVITYEYDDLDRIIKKIDKFNGNTKITEYIRELGKTEIKKYDNTGNLFETVYLTFDDLGLDLLEKKTTNHNENTINYAYYETDFLFGYITKEKKETKYGTEETEFIFDEFTFLTEKKTKLSSKYYSYTSDHANWITMVETNSSGKMLGYYKRAFKYHDGKETGDISEGISSTAAATSGEINTADKAQFWIDPDETWWFKVGDVQIANESVTAWFDDHIVLYHAKSGSTYLMKNYDTRTREMWHEAELLSTTADAVWYRRSNGNFNVIEKGVYWDNIPSIWSKEDLLVRDDNDVIKYRLPNFKTMSNDVLYEAVNHVSSGSGSYDCLYGNCNTGYGERVGKYDKSRYEGFLKNATPHGPGYLVYDNGDEAMAEFQNGKKNGLGLYEWANGTWYIGYFKDDQLHGYGMYVENNIIKPGLFKNGNYDIQYDYYNNDKTSGCVSGECDNGFGKWVYDNGDSYTGWFVNSQMHGLGFYQFSSGGNYVGEWNKGIKEGYGMYEWDADSNYAGYWKSDKLHGLGVYYYKENGKSLEMSGMFNMGNHETWDVRFDY